MKSHLPYSVEPQVLNTFSVEQQQQQQQQQ
jgi:hypothetical protein